MSEQNKDIREPIQRRSIEKKQKIIKYGFKLMCEKGYYNTNTAEIAKAAGVSTGIVYQYFQDKHDIMLQAIHEYSNELLFPIANLEYNENESIEQNIKTLINNCINQHKISKEAHEEIYSLQHSDKDVEQVFKDEEVNATKEMANSLIKHGIVVSSIMEKCHIIICLIDNLCHEIVYHKHDIMNLDEMTNIVINIICNLLTEK